MRVLLVTLAAAAALAAPDKEAAPVPEIPIEHQMEYFRTDGKLAHLTAQMTEAQAEYDAAVSALRRDCGAAAVPVPAKDGKHLLCISSQPPEAPASPAAAKK